MSPYRPRSHQIADKAVVRLHDAFVSAGWTVEDLDKDYGEDLLVRIFKNGQATPYTFYVQSKSTSNVARYVRRNDAFISYPFKAQHLEHWNDFWEPVVLTIWDSQADVTYWETVQMAERPPGIARKRPVFFIPLSNVLNDEGIKRIASRTVQRHRRFAMEQQGAQLLVDRLQEVLGIGIDYNPQAGLLIVTNADGSAGLTPFGKMAERLESMARDSDISIEELLESRILWFCDLLDAFRRDGELVMEDKMGRETGRWNSLEGFLRDSKRSQELRDAP